MAIFSISLSVFGQGGSPEEYTEKYSNGQIKSKGYRVLTITNPSVADSSILRTASAKKYRTLGVLV